MFRADKVEPAKFYLDDCAYLIIEPHPEFGLRFGKVALHLQVDFPKESIKITRFIEPHIAIRICNALYAAASEAAGIKRKVEEVKHEIADSERD